MMRAPPLLACLARTRARAGEKPYVCSVADCDKSYSRKDHLDRHMCTHTGEAK
jgi:Zinc finger, C2H2 type